MGQSAENKQTTFAEQNGYFCFVSHFFFYCLLSCTLVSLSYGDFFVWRHIGGSQSPECCGSCKVRGKSWEGEIVGDKGMVTKEEGILFIRGLGMEERKS